jgi:hypothetical protein
MGDDPKKKTLFFSIKSFFCIYFQGLSSWVWGKKGGVFNYLTKGSLEI